MYSGVHSQLQLVDTCDNIAKSIYLFGKFQNKNAKIPVPLYFRKILHISKSDYPALTKDEAIVFVTVNNPYLNSNDRQQHHLCKKPITAVNPKYEGQKIKIPRWILKDDSAGYSYLCELKDFLDNTEIYIQELAGLDVDLMFMNVQ